MVDVTRYVGNKIREYRKIKNMTQKELGKKIGVKHNTISSYESGTNEVEQNMIFKLADALGVGINDLFPPTQSNKFNHKTIEFNKLEVIPIVGKVAAGTPNYAEEDIIGYMTLPPNKTTNEGMIYLEVSSDSMDKQFPIGSYVLVDSTAQIENGDIAVVKINGDEATLKQTKFDYDNNKMYLIPNSNNGNYYPQVLDISEEKIIIVGKVIGMYQSI